MRKEASEAMSTFAYMKVLESAPARYDRGIRILSRGRIESVYARIAKMVAAPGRRILDIGCGTGGVSLACATRGADVIGIDRSPGMLEVARSKSTSGVSGRVEWMELSAAEIGDRVPEESLDAAVACLSFSELSREEQRYVLEVVRSCLRPRGVLVIADEAVPSTRLRRIGYRLARLPVAGFAYALTQTRTHPLRDPTALVREAGFVDVESERLWSGSFVILRAGRGRDGG